jgi:hypothetical protein
MMQQFEADLRKCWINNTYMSMGDAIRANIPGFLTTYENDHGNLNRFAVSRNGDMLVGFRVPENTQVKLWIGGVCYDTFEAKAKQTYFAIFDKYPIPLISIAFHEVVYEATCETIEFIYYSSMDSELRGYLAYSGPFVKQTALEYIGFKNGLAFSCGIEEEAKHNLVLLPRLDDLVRI